METQPNKQGVLFKPLFLTV